MKTEKARLALSLAKDKLRITNLRSQISCRRKTLVEMQNQEDNAHRNLLSNIKSETSLIQDKINTTQRSIIAQQLTMCRTLTQFYNLRPTPPSVSDTSSYSLFNFLIPNLMAYLHTFSHEELITSLENFCRFLVQKAVVSSY
ncbi:Protein of unknown function [Pyronema omphalodes CBS 100304]|uniref:Autophagy-related protein 14 n=1 Tax=Pyronema omphalodes (strain CBS 100304) TaxID=1076935 RepID=U4LU45_PYROM|nr:Protein of unknown function [Pyronema omphalodes CBS 100304]